LTICDIYVFLLKKQGIAMISRAQALDLLREHCGEDALIKHSLATEAVMQALAKRLGHDADKWGIAGLLHDLDYDETKEDPHRHTLRTEEILRARGSRKASLRRSRPIMPRS
jgi:putative nucleotidyltransferase with HDIG domain